jgi:hypothetical protein
VLNSHRMVSKFESLKLVRRKPSEEFGKIKKPSEEFDKIKLSTGGRQTDCGVR